MQFATEADVKASHVYIVGRTNKPILTFGSKTGSRNDSSEEQQGSFCVLHTLGQSTVTHRGWGEGHPVWVCSNI